MGCSLFFRHVSKFLMVALAHKSPCVDCGNGQKNEQPSSPCSGIISVTARRLLSSGPMLTYPLPWEKKTERSSKCFLVSYTYTANKPKLVKSRYRCTSICLCYSNLAESVLAQQEGMCHCDL